MGSPKKPLRIIVVDDLPDVAESLARLLEVMGHEAVYTVDPRAAPDIARNFRPDIAFLDLGMPHIDGYQLAERLRATPECEKMFLVALSAYAEPEHRVLSRKAGFDAHVRKPIDPALLESTLTQYSATDPARRR